MKYRAVLNIQIKRTKQVPSLHRHTSRSSVLLSYFFHFLHVVFSACLSVCGKFLQACITFFSLMTLVTEVDLQSEPTSPSAVLLEVTEPPALPLPSKLPPPAGLAKPCTPSFPVLPFPPSTSLPDEAVAPLHPGPTRALSMPPALQAIPKDYATHKPPLSAPATGPDTLSSWAQSQWIAFSDAFVPCRGPSHQPARPRSVPVSQQPKLFFREIGDPFGSIGKEESTSSLNEAPARSMQDGNIEEWVFISMFQHCPMATWQWDKCTEILTNLMFLFNLFKFIVIVWISFFISFFLFFFSSVWFILHFLFDWWQFIFVCSALFIDLNNTNVTK